MQPPLEMCILLFVAACVAQRHHRRRHAVNSWHSTALNPDTLMSRAEKALLEAQTKKRVGRVLREVLDGYGLAEKDIERLRRVEQLEQEIADMEGEVRSLESRLFKEQQRAKEKARAPPPKAAPAKAAPAKEAPKKK